MTKKQVFFGIVVVVVVVVAWILLSARTGKAPVQNQNNNQQEQQGNQNNGGQETKPTEQEMNSGSTAEGGTTVSGTLQVSDNPNRGKLMLVTSDRTVYIFTSRDYSSLIGKDVVMHYEGTLDDFMLGDIVVK